MGEVDERQAFEAALSFVEEFSFDGEAAAGLPPALDAVPAQIQGDVTGWNCSAGKQAAQCRAPTKRLPLSEERRRKQREANERRKLLRKAGVYGDSNRVRNERTREIAFLKEQTERLQLDLQLLQARRAQEQKEAGEPGTTALIARNEASISVWKEQATRQRRRREETERDNVKLRLAVERQRGVASSLKGLMQKRASQLTNECATLVDTCCSKRNTVDVLDFSGDIGAFRDLFCRLDAAYRDIDAVFTANGLATRTVAANGVHVREGVEGKYLEFFTYKDLPFDLQDTTEAAWDHLKGVEKHLGNGSLYQKAAKNLDEPYTIIEDFSKEVYSNTSRADVKVKQVVRRYVEPDRDVVIWVSHTIPAQVKHKLLRGLSYNFCGYAVTKRSPLSTPGNELTQLQLCSRISLDQGQESRYGADNARALTNFIIVHATKNILMHREVIENTLADRALHRIELSS